MTAILTLEEKTCGKCGGVFALNQEFVSFARNNAGGYHCPYCQTGWSWTESIEDRLRKQLETKERELRESKCETLRERQHRERVETQKAKAERKLKRVQNGVCPECRRSFLNLQQHMKTQHCRKQEEQ